MVAQPRYAAAGMPSTLHLAGPGAVAQALDLIVPFFRGFFHGGSLIFMLLYLWSKRNPTAPISLFGLIQLQVRRDVM
jgi:hypothetical protein